MKTKLLKKLRKRADDRIEIVEYINGLYQILCEGRNWVNGGYFYDVTKKDKLIFTFQYTYISKAIVHQVRLAKRALILKWVRELRN